MRRGLGAAIGSLCVFVAPRAAWADGQEYHEAVPVPYVPPNLTVLRIRSRRRLGRGSDRADLSHDAGCVARLHVRQAERARGAPAPLPKPGLGRRLRRSSDVPGRPAVRRPGPDPSARRDHVFAGGPRGLRAAGAGFGLGNLVSISLLAGDDSDRQGEVLGRAHGVRAQRARRPCRSHHRFVPSQAARRR